MVASVKSEIIGRQHGLAGKVQVRIMLPESKWKLKTKQEEK